jgi:hypothetical protein
MDVVERAARVLQRALQIPGARAIVRIPEQAVAEVLGCTEVSACGAWLRIGVEQSSHIHLKAAAIRHIRLSIGEDRNAAVEVVGAGELVLLRVSFSQTNPARPHHYLADRRAEVERAFAGLPRGSDA